MDFDKLNKYLNPIVERPSSKKWTILKLEPFRHKDGELFTQRTAVAEKRPIREPNEFRDCLKQALRPMFKTVVYVKFHDGALWAAIDMLSIGLKHQKMMIYLVHYPHAQFVFVSSFKNKAVQSSLHDALCDVFHCEQIRVVNCKGSDLISLADMALHPLSQGSFGAYRLYTTILDSNLFDDEEVKQDERRRTRLNDVAGERITTLTGNGGIVSPNKARRFQTAGGLGVAVDESKGLNEAAANSGVLSREQREKLTAGTNALNEIKLMVDHDLEWGGKTTKFSCTLVVRGANVIRGITKLADKGMVQPGQSVSEVVADASNVIRDAFEAQDKRKGKKRRSHEGTENAEDRKMVRTVAVRCM